MFLLNFIVIWFYSIFSIIVNPVCLFLCKLPNHNHTLIKPLKIFPKSITPEEKVFVFHIPEQTVTLSNDRKITIALCLDDWNKRWHFWYLQKTTIIFTQMAEMINNTFSEDREKDDTFYRQKRTMRLWSITKMALSNAEKSMKVLNDTFDDDQKINEQNATRK